MKLKRILPLLMLNLAICGLLSSGKNPSLYLIPSCMAANIQNPTGRVDPDFKNSLEQELLAFVNQERIQQGLTPLVLDEQLTGLARSQSADMAHQGFISHDQPSGSLQIRMEKSGYLFKVARENVGSASSIDLAHRLFLESPPHKENILARDVTRIGVGIFWNPDLCDDYMYITELFATPREEYHPSMVQNFLEGRVEDLRRKGAGSMYRDPLLEKLASSSLASLKTPYDKTELQSLLTASARELQQAGDNALPHLQVSVQLLHNPQNLSIPLPDKEGRAETYGAAVRQITDGRNQPAFLVLTLLGITN